MNSSWDEASHLPFSNSGSQDSCIQDCSATRCLYVLQGKAAKMNFRPNPKEKLKRKQHAWLTISVLYLWLDNVGKEWFSLADRLHSCEHSSRNMLLACLSLNYWAGTWEYPQGKKKKKNLLLFNLSRGRCVFQFLQKKLLYPSQPSQEGKYGKFTAKGVTYSLQWPGHKRTASFPQILSLC